MLLLYISVAPYDVEITGTRRYPYGTDIELVCTSEGAPDLDYSWTFMNMIVDDDDTLNIGSADVSNGGDYTCVVTNNAGNASNTTTVYGKLIMIILMMASFKLHD